jgi:hypothetical protein
LAISATAAASPTHHHRYHTNRHINPAPAIRAIIDTFVGTAATAAAMSGYGYDGPGPYEYAPTPYYSPPRYYGPRPFYTQW